MARIITDSIYAKLVEHLAKDETVALFQQLLLSPKTNETEMTSESEEENQMIERRDNE